MRKKLLALLLAVVLAVGLLPTAFAADAPTSGTCGENLTWSYSDGVLTISGAGEMDASFQDWFYGWFYYQDSIKSVVIEDGVTTIDANAFAQFYSLTSVSIPDSVTIIGHHAFYGCENLTDMTIPDGVTSIGVAAFLGCKSLTSLTIPDGVTTIDNEAFGYCSLTSLTIPNGVTSIGERAFGYCTSLTDVTIPDSVTTIDSNAFWGCESLTDVYYGGSNAQWGQILCNGDDFFQGIWQLTFSNGGQEAARLDGATIHYNSTGPDTTKPAEPEPEKPAFTDVPAGEWYAAPVAWAIEKNITNGTTDTTFSPNQTCTHAQILTFLYRANRGKGAAAAEDMAKAVSWAREKGMIDGSFDPNAHCTRADAMKYIWQAFGSPSAADNSFTDVPAGADCAAAVSWGVANGVTNGYTDGTFRPGNTCTRGQIVTFLHRAYVPAAALK